MQSFDLEIYKNYFLAQFKDFDTGAVTYFEMYPGKAFDGRTAMQKLKSDTTVTFNGNKFDLPLFGQACAGKSCEEIKALSDKIIVEDKRCWELGIDAPKCDHIDLIEVAPGMASLKIYGGRMHTKKMQDLPIEPDAMITTAQRSQLRRYCENDLDNTMALYRKLSKQIDLRSKMGKEYGIDLRSKSDSQIAESVIKAEVGKLTGEVVTRPRFSAGASFNYKAPSFIQFKTPEMQETLDFVTGVKFALDANGSPKCKALESRKVIIGDMRYTMGVGGLHSNEKKVFHVADNDHLLIDRDVASYYPSIILNCELYPEHLGREFLDVYRTIVNRRLAAKRSGDKVTADSLKITINGSFGKLGSKWSCLYSPDLLIQVTVTGQLSLLMLIEAQNAKGGLLGKQLEAVVVDPASDWPLFAEKARELLTVSKVDVMFGCWTSVSRKSVLPVIEKAMASGQVCRLQNVSCLGPFDRVTQTLVAMVEGLLDGVRQCQARPGFQLIGVDDHGVTRTLLI